jgi:FixJ family two-component response regulator
MSLVEGELAVESTVYIVDDDSDVLETLQQQFQSVLMNVQCFDSGDNFLHAIGQFPVGCLITDMRMPGLSGIDVLRELNKRSIILPVIMITAYDDLEPGIRSMKEGAVDYIQKPFSFQLLLKCVQQAVGKSVSAYLAMSKKAPFVGALESLSAREREVLELIVAGEQTKRIAGNLNISEKTVEFHRKNIRQKTGTRNLAELIKFYIDVSGSSET